MSGRRGVVLSGLGVFDALDLDEGSVGVGVALATLVRQMSALDIHCAGLLAWCRS